MAAPLLRALPLLPLLLACGSIAAQDSREPVHLTELALPDGWRAAGVELVGQPMSAHLSTGWILAGPDASFEVEVSLADATSTAASVIFGGNHVGLCGRDGMPFVEGPLFGGRASALMETDVAPGQRVRIGIAREGGRVVVRWDGEQARQVADPRGSLGGSATAPAGRHDGPLDPRARCEAAPRPVGRSVPVWRAGDDGVHTYRIPAMVLCANGELLAFAEARRGSSGDTGDIDLVARRSADGGRTWSAQTVVWDDGANTCGNPCPVVAEDGTIVLLSTRNLGHDHESEIIAGTSERTRTVWVLRSEDHGVTWSAPEEITADVKDPGWTWYATGPGAGIRMERGAHAGRLVIPCDHIERGTRRYLSHVIHSDDGGRTWRPGGSSPLDQVNECEVAELEDGALLLNMRNYDRAQRAAADGQRRRREDVARSAPRARTRGAHLSSEPASALLGDGAGAGGAALLQSREPRRARGHDPARLLRRRRHLALERSPGRGAGGVLVPPEAAGRDGRLPLRVRALPRDPRASGSSRATSPRGPEPPAARAHQPRRSRIASPPRRRGGCRAA